MKTTAKTVMSLAALSAAVAATMIPFASRAGLREDFARPQGAVRENTGPLFWMHGDDTEEHLREMVGRVAESGQGVLTIESRPHIDWMRDGWWRDVRIVIDECKKRGLKAMIYDDYWWPSQGMGGKYPIPEQFQCRDVKGTVYANEDLPDGTFSNEVARVNVKEIGKGVYRIGPDGDKTIVYTWFTSKGGYRFPTVNGLDEAAVDWFISQYYQPYWDRFERDFKDGTIPGFFFDEPQFRSFWGDALAKELEARGDDAGELLTALKFRLADADDQARAIYRYHDARAEVWGRTMYGRQSDWCKKHGVFSSGHFLEHDTDHYSPVRAGGNVMQQMKYVEVPGVDLVCRQYYPNQRESVKHQIAFGQIPKYASSTAHVYNRHNGKNWCEIFGAYGQDITYPQMKWHCDWHQSQGCYYMIPHSFNPRAPYDRDCPPYFYNGGKEPRYPLFRVWADYNNRCALLLSDGEHVCHIAQCVPGVSFHAGKTIRPEMFAFAIQDAQLDSDWMLYDAVESAIIEKPGERRAWEWRASSRPQPGQSRGLSARPSLRTANGKEFYDILSLPATEYVPYGVLEKALAFAKAGGVVVGYGIKPCNTPTKGKSAEDTQRIVAEIFAQPTALFLEGEPDGAALRAALAKAYPSSPNATEAKSGGCEPLAVRDFDFEGLSAADGRMLAVNHYEKDGDVRLFIANQDFNRRRDLALRAKWPAEKAELWDPMQGTVEKPVVENGLVKIALEPSQAVFVVWPKTASVQQQDGGKDQNTCCSTLAVFPGGATTSVQQQDTCCSTLAVSKTTSVQQQGSCCSTLAVSKQTTSVQQQVVAAAIAETVTPVTIEGAEEEPALAAALNYAKWIWHPVKPKAKGKVVFRAKIDAPSADEAQIVFSCDNEAYVRVNGSEIAKQKTGLSNDGWRNPTGAKFRLRRGVNEIEVLADNVLPGPAGFVCAVKWPAGMLLSGADSWEVSRKGEAPVKPLEICRYGKDPWGKLGPASKVTRSPYAESVATTLSFAMPALAPGERVYFVCDGTEGERSAAIEVNGEFAGGFIGAPYRLDITKAVKTGANALIARPFRIKNPRIVIVKSRRDALEAGFAAPPRSAKPQTWYHLMNGNVTKEGITRDFEALAEAGFGGVQIFDVGCGIPEGELDFCSDAWFDMLRHAHNEAKRLGLALGIHNCSGWSSSGGPWVKPEDAMKVTMHSETVVTGPARFSRKLPRTKRDGGFYADIAVLAYPTPDGAATLSNAAMKTGRERKGMSVERAALARDTKVPPASQIITGKIIDLTSKLAKDGTLTWDVPEGKWTIFRLGYVCNKRKNRLPSSKGAGLEVDKFSSAALDRHFDIYMGRLCKMLGFEKGRKRQPDATGLANIHVDSWEVGCQNWTHGLEKIFEARAGYSIVPYLPVLAGHIVGSVEESESFLEDFRRLLADLLVENYAKRLAERCHEYGLEFSCEPYGPSNADDFQYGECVDIPMSCFWVDGTCGPGKFPCMDNSHYAASLAHIWGRRYAADEAFTSGPPRGGRWLETPFSIKWQGDRAFAGGCNMLVYHRFTHQPWADDKHLPGMTMGRWGMHLDRTQTWWKFAYGWFLYQARCQWMLQEGKYVADALFWDGEGVPKHGWPKIDLPKGYGFDACGTKTVEMLKVKDGKLVVPGGVEYRILVLPDVETMSERLVRRIGELAAQGAQIVAPGRRPVRAPGRRGGHPVAPAAYKALVDSAWTKGVMCCAPAEALKRLGIEPDFASDAKDAAWIHRRDGSADWYFVARGNKKAASFEASFRETGRVPEIWNAETGEIADAAQWRTANGRTFVTLDFPPCGSAFVVFRREGNGGRGRRVEVNAPQDCRKGKEATTASVQQQDGEKEQNTCCSTLAVFPGGATTSVQQQEIAGPWKVEFPIDWYSGGTDIKTVDWKELKDWTTDNDPDIKYFSGTATYETEIVLDQETLKGIREGGIRNCEGVRSGKGIGDGKGVRNGERIILDLGEVKDFAQVKVNGREYPPMWRPPYKIDITDAIAWSGGNVASEKTGKTGESGMSEASGKSEKPRMFEVPGKAEKAGKAGVAVISIRVCNRWPNRLIGDEVMYPDDCEWVLNWHNWQKLNEPGIKEIPRWVKEGKPSPTGRHTFTTWKHWTKDDALLPSGLLGPVVLLRGGADFR